MALAGPRAGHVTVWLGACQRGVASVRAKERAFTFAVCVTDLFRAAAEVGPHHILKMYNINGNMVNISPQLEANSPDSYYRLEVVTSDVKGERGRLRGTPPPRCFEA